MKVVLSKPQKELGEALAAGKYELIIKRKFQAKRNGNSRAAYILVIAGRKAMRPVKGLLVSTVEKLLTAGLIRVAHETDHYIYMESPKRPRYRRLTQRFGDPLPVNDYVRSISIAELQAMAVDYGLSIKYELKIKAFRISRLDGEPLKNPYIDVFRITDLDIVEWKKQLVDACIKNGLGVVDNAESEESEQTGSGQYPGETKEIQRQSAE